MRPDQELIAIGSLPLGTSCKNTLKSCASHLVLLHGKGKCVQGIQNHIFDITIQLILKRLLQQSEQTKPFEGETQMP